MADPRFEPVDRLEKALLDLGRRIDYPPPSQVAAAVARRLVAEAQERPAAAKPKRGSRRAVVVLAALGLLLLATAAVAALISVGGIELRIVETPTLAPPRSLQRLGLGTPVSPAEARRAAGFEVRVPDLPELGPPDHVLFDPSVAGGQVALVYLPGPGLPEIGDTGLAMVITQFDGRVDGVKEVPADQPPEQVTFDGQFGYWIEGPHRFAFVDSEGREREGTTVLVGSTLLWSRDGVVYRVESALARDQAIRVGAALLG